MASGDKVNGSEKTTTGDELRHYVQSILNDIQCLTVAERESLFSDINTLYCFYCGREQNWRSRCQCRNDE